MLHRLEFNSIDNKNVLSSIQGITSDGDADDVTRRGHGMSHEPVSRGFSSNPSAITPHTSNIHVSVDFNPRTEESWTLIRGLRPATNYSCFMRAENEIGLSPPSPRLRIQTDEEGAFFHYPSPCSLLLSSCASVSWELQAAVAVMTSFCSLSCQSRDKERAADLLQ